MKKNTKAFETLCLDDVVSLIVDKNKDNKDNLNKSAIKEIIVMFKDAVIDSLKNGKSVYIVNGWTFELVESKEKTLKNPKTKQIVQVPKGVKVRIKLSSKIKEAVKKIIVD